MINFSILGFGHIGHIHKKAILDNPNAELCSIIDFGLPEDPSTKTYNTLENFLNDDTKTDVVVIATPSGLHRDHAMRCLKAGKNVLVEKPLALYYNDAKEIVEYAKNNNLRVFSSMQLRFSPVVQYVKKIINNSSLGTIFMVSVQCFFNRNKNYYKLRDWHGKNELDGGILFTQFSQFIDVLNYWLGEITLKNAWSENFAHEGLKEFNDDSGVIHFSTENGVLGSMVYTTATFNKNFENTISIIAEKGTIKIGGEYLNKMLYIDTKNVCCSNNISTEQTNFHHELIDEVCRSLLDEKESIIDAKNALGLVNFIEKVSNFSKEDKKLF